MTLRPCITGAPAGGGGGSRTKRPRTSGVRPTAVSVGGKGTLITRPRGTGSGVVRGRGGEPSPALDGITRGRMATGDCSPSCPTSADQALGR